MYLETLKTITTKLTIYYDGECPLCLSEIHFLKHHNHKKLLHFISLQAVNENAEGIQCALAFKTIHARLGNHKIIVGPEVFLKLTKEPILDSSITFSLSVYLDSYTQSFTEYSQSIDIKFQEQLVLYC